MGRRQRSLLRICAYLGVGAFWGSPSPHWWVDAVLRGVLQVVLLGLLTLLEVEYGDLATTPPSHDGRRDVASPSLNLTTLCLSRVCVTMGVP